MPRRSALLLAGVLLVFALALGTRAVRGAQAGRSLVTGRAEWIWKPLGRSESSPAAFALVRDFYLDPPPAHGRLLVSADEEYVLYLNGRRIGSGRYARATGKGGERRGTLLDRYEVGDLLTPGTNRLQAEVRSGRGVGGFLLAVVEGATGRVLLGTDESWRLYQRYHPYLLRGLVPLSPKLELGTGEDVHSWGLPPLGRWGVPTPGPERPLFSDQIADQIADPTGDREPSTATRRVLTDPPAPGLPPVERTVFDFGREVTGYLSFTVTPDPVQRSALLFTSSAGVPEVPGTPPDGAILTLPGRQGWEAAVPRRFRYALVVGLSPLAARVQTIRVQTVEGDLPLLSPAPGGVLGIVPPALRTPVEDEVWRKFERIPGVARRKDL